MFELLDIVPNEYLIFSWKGEIIVDNFWNGDYIAFRCFALDNEHLYTRSFHKFWIENVEESFKKEMMKEQ